MESRIQRSLSETIWSVVIALGGGGVGWLGWWWSSTASGLAWLIAWVLIIGGALALVGGIWVAIRESGSAPCPACGKPVGGLDAKVAERYVPCKSCARYVVCRTGVVKTVGDEVITVEPTFEAKVPGQIRWPESCCLCSAPATREVEVHAQTSQAGTNVALLAVGVVRTGGGTRYTLRVPHCAEHDGGAALTTASGEEPPIKLRFRWYGYQQEFLALNFGQKL